MKTGLVLPCSALALLFLQACGGGDAKAPVASPAVPPAVSPAVSPAQTPAPATAPAPQEAAPTPKKPTPPVRVDTVMAKQLFGMAPMAPVVDNPSTPEKVALGKVLFDETSLSKNGNISCASCHDLANYGQDGKPTSPGTDGKNGERNTPTVWNASRQFVQFWDGRAASVEQQSTVHMLSPVMHGLADEAALVAKLKAKPELAAGFEKAFPGGDAVTVKNFELAIGVFLRTLVTKSRFEKFLEGDQKAITNEEKLGFNKFLEAGCQACHMGSLYGGSMFQKTGVVKPYSSTDPGRAGITKSDADKSMFKVPTLLNVEKTGPYYHDGKVATLELAVSTMADMQLGKTLKPEEVASIVAFLKSLTGPLPELK